MRNFSIKKNVLFAVFIVLIVAFQSGFYNDISPEDLKKIYSNEYSKFIEIDGMQVHYRDEGKGFPIVLIHGTAASLHTWDAWNQELIKNYRVIRMDLPAFG
uniref:alpha/beta fold hydrolase n=1 Tax=Polaribacter sp. TaxID=1920175 RepID=UPI0040480EEB